MEEEEKRQRRNANKEEKMTEKSRWKRKMRGEKKES